MQTWFWTCSAEKPCVETSSAEFLLRCVRAEPVDETHDHIKLQTCEPVLTSLIYPCQRNLTHR